MVSFDSDHSAGDGASFFSLRSVLIIPPVSLGCLGRVFFWSTLLISGVVDRPSEVLRVLGLQAGGDPVAGVGVGLEAWKILVFDIREIQLTLPEWLVSPHLDN